MNKLLILLLLIFSMGVSAQKKEIAQAKTNIKNGANLEAVEKSMRALLTDSANRQNPKIWLLLHGAVKKQYDLGNEKLYLKQQYDTAQLFLIAKKMFDVLESFDSIDAQPDQKGRIKPKYRKKHAALLDTYRQNIYSGGAYFIRKQRYKEAYSMYQTYLDCAHQPVFQDYRYIDADGKLPEAAYWAVYCGYKQNDPKQALKYAEWARQDTAHVQYLLQYLAESYLMTGDTIKSVEYLKEGFSKYPTNTFFTPRLIDYYCDRQEFDTAMIIVDEAIRSHQDNWLYRFAKSTICLNTGKYEECIALCDELLMAEDTLADAYHNAGKAYYQLALNKRNEVGIDRTRRQEYLELFRRALPYLERYRMLAPNATAKWALPLYTIYLNLNMGEEFEEMEKILNQQNTSKP